MDVGNVFSDSGGEIDPSVAATRTEQCFVRTHQLCENKAKKTLVWLFAYTLLNSGKSVGLEEFQEALVNKGTLQAEICCRRE